MSGPTEIPIFGQTRIEVIPGQYYVVLEEGSFLVLRIPVSIDHAGVNFQPATLLARIPGSQEYKHYRDNGSKFWSQKAGVELYFAVDRRHIRLIQEDGGSYPRVCVGNAIIRLTVGGGGSPWTDSIHTQVTACTNPRMTVLREVARVSMTVEQARTAGVKIDATVDPNDKHMNTVLVRHAIRRQLVPGSQIILADGFSFQSSQELKFVQGVNSQSMICERGGWKVRVTIAKIDWQKTATANNLNTQLPQAASYNKLG